MARGPPKHLKRLAAPRHWMLAKLGGLFAPRPRGGAHKLRESLPLAIIIRNRLRYALTYRECMMITKQRHIKVDGRIRTDPKYAAGFMDVITIEATGEKYRVLYDTKGRMILHPIKEQETNFKLCKVRKLMYGPKRTPVLQTSDGRTIRFPDPNLKRHDSIVLDLHTNKIREWVRFKPGCHVMVTGGANTGRVGEVISRERHPGSFDIVHIKDSAENKFATRIDNVFVIGATSETLISLPKLKGVRLSTVEDRERKMTHRARQILKQKKQKSEKGMKKEKPKNKKQPKESKPENKIENKGKSGNKRKAESKGKKQKK